MKKTFLVVSILIISSAIFAQDEIPSLETVKVPDLNRPVAEDFTQTWLDLARKIFPDVMSDDNSLSRSNPIRLFSKNAGWFEIKERMSIVEVKDYWFEDEGKLRLAMFFHLKTLDGKKNDLFIIGIYQSKPTFELIDAIDVRLEGYEKTQMEGGFTELAIGADKRERGTVHLVDTRRISSNSTEETHRFLMLEGNKLRVVAVTPAFINRKNCDGELRQTLTIRQIDQPKTDFPVHEFTFEHELTPNRNCENLKYYGINEYDIYRVTWDAARRVFRRKLFKRGGYLTGAWGTYDPDEYERFRGNPAALKISIGYEAEAFYDPRNSEIRIAAAGKLPRGTTVKFEFEDYWGVSPGEARSIVRGKIKFQITDYEIIFLSGNRRRIFYHCLVYAFGKRSRFNE